MNFKLLIIFLFYRYASRVLSVRVNQKSEMSMIIKNLINNSIKQIKYILKMNNSAYIRKRKCESILEFLHLIHIIHLFKFKQ